MIISHMHINYRFSVNIIKDCPLYNKQKNTWMLGNTRFISRVEHDISLGNSPNPESICSTHIITSTATNQRAEFAIITYAEIY